MGRSSRSIAIQNYLPHRDPMLMVDIISEISGEAVICVMQVSTLLGDIEIMNAELNLFLQKQ